MIGSSNVGTNFPRKLLLTDTEVSKIYKTFANGSSANIKFSKTQLSQMIQSEGFVNNVLFDPDKTVKKIINKVDELYKKSVT